MHPNPRFHLTDRDLLRRMISDIGFGILFVAAEEGPRAVHVPVHIEGDRLRFHVSRRNAIAPHAYISPDWYGLEDRVPTWNYVAVEVEGPVQPLDEVGLEQLLGDLSNTYEARLEPKPIWTRDKMGSGRFEAMIKAISGFEMEITGWRATAKLDQDKPEDVRERLCDALVEHGQVELAAAMRPGGWLE